jgi:hypothetical protein
LVAVTVVVSVTSVVTVRVWSSVKVIVWVVVVVVPWSPVDPCVTVELEEEFPYSVIVVGTNTVDTCPEPVITEVVVTVVVSVEPESSVAAAKRPAAQMTVTTMTPARATPDIPLRNSVIRSILRLNGLA